ncbi:KTSC domain-containing protein [Aeromicrobium duanguangcaii]|uniref:KTSC domain-containing protein n=1 Tax=Aeromicrobium duanguangcaii TaxID=2968086 RepID=A0ABY5KBE8_9ACTN|nr:KTSC domain-containing protein [Aeromicrobium duanguangcaii]MCD9154796.1 KTSC domain-containing protein [Aeromicrobium duanguangcaii]UUI67789.1 KTSC domain-containing protein [Aeromicrobium duanguangcaii]
MELRPLGRSEALESAAYDDASGTLRVRFRNGGLYDYLDVPRDVFDRLVEADHPWTTWQEHITTAYDYRRLD